MAIPIFCHSVNLKRPPIPFLRRPQLNFRVDIREVAFLALIFRPPASTAAAVTNSYLLKLGSIEGDGGIGLKG